MKKYTALLLWEGKKYVESFAQHWFMTGSAGRTQDQTQKGYEKTWGEDLRDLRAAHPRLSWVDGRLRKVYTRDLDHLYVQQHYQMMKPRIEQLGSGVKVLEMGGGYGRVTFPLSILFPDAKFHAVEYAHSGPKTAQIYQQQYREEIAAIAATVATVYDKEPWVERFEQGDGKSLRYADGSFDIAYTNIALEQIPKREDHRPFLQEMQRVTKRYCFFLEPWKEAQNILTYAYLRNVDYFRQSYKMLYDVGFRKARFYPMCFHHNPKFKLGYVVAEP